MYFEVQPLGTNSVPFLYVVVENASSAIAVGCVLYEYTACNLLYVLNAFFSIFVTDAGIDTLVKLQSLIPHYTCMLYYSEW